MVRSNVSQGLEASAQTEVITAPLNTAIPSSGQGPLASTGQPSLRFETEVQPELHTAGFAPAFSARIATMARDGVEMARVHLNPVDMGPVSVQLSLEGGHVRVDMAAERSATRQALEQALPTLAGALREAGFTLSGGGVHQGLSDTRSQAGQDNGSNSNSSNAAPSPGSEGTGSGPAAGGPGAQGGFANAFRQEAQRQQGEGAARVVTVGGEPAGRAAESTVPNAARRSNALVDVFA